MGCDEYEWYSLGVLNEWDWIVMCVFLELFSDKGLNNFVDKFYYHKVALL